MGPLLMEPSFWVSVSIDSAVHKFGALGVYGLRVWHPEFGGAGRL